MLPCDKQDAKAVGATATKERRKAEEAAEESLALAEQLQATVDELHSELESSRKSAPVEETGKQASPLSDGCFPCPLPSHSPRCHVHSAPGRDVHPYPTKATPFRTLYNAQCTLHTAYCTLHIAYCTLHNAQ